MIPLDELLMLPAIQKSIRFHTYNIADPVERQDLTQDIYLAIIKSYDSIKDPDKAESFCHEVIKRQKWNYYRSKKRNAERYFLHCPVVDEENEEMQDMVFVLEEDFNYGMAELQESYMNIRAKFTTSETLILDSIIIECRFNLGFRGETTEIATALGVTKAHVSKTIKKLRDLI